MLPSSLSRRVLVAPVYDRLERGSRVPVPVSLDLETERQPKALKLVEREVAQLATARVDYRVAEEHALVGVVLRSVPSTGPTRVEQLEGDLHLLSRLVLLRVKGRQVLEDLFGE